LWLPFFIAWDVPDQLLPGRADAPAHPSGASGIEAVEVGGDEATLRAWLGEGDRLPIVLVDEEPGVRAVRFVTEHGDVFAVA